MLSSVPVACQRAPVDSPCSWDQESVLVLVQGFHAKDWPTYLSFLTSQTTANWKLPSGGSETDYIIGPSYLDDLARATASLIHVRFRGSEPCEPSLTCVIPNIVANNYLCKWNVGVFSRMQSSRRILFLIQLNYLFIYEQWIWWEGRKPPSAKRVALQLRFWSRNQNIFPAALLSISKWAPFALLLHWHIECE